MRTFDRIYRKHRERLRSCVGSSVAFVEHNAAEQFSVPFYRMVEAWSDWADDYSAELTEAKIGDDGVLGDEWRAIGEAMLALLNGPTRGLDGRTMDSTIRAIAREHGAPVTE